MLPTLGRPIGKYKTKFIQCKQNYISLTWILHFMSGIQIPFELHKTHFYYLKTGLVWHWDLHFIENKIYLQLSQYRHVQPPRQQGRVERYCH